MNRSLGPNPAELDTSGLEFLTGLDLKESTTRGLRNDGLAVYDCTHIDGDCFRVMVGVENLELWWDYL